MWNGMRDVARCICGCDLKYGIAKLQSGITCCERCWCDTKGVIWWRMVCHGTWCGLEYVRDGIWCGMMQCKMWWNDVRDAMAMCNTFHISPPQINNISHKTFPAQHTIPHIASFHTTPHLTHFITTRSHGVMWNSVVWNLVWCATSCNARCGVLCLIYPNVAVVWNKMRCMWHVMSCNVRCVKCGDGVVHGKYGGVLWCKMWNVWLWNTEWCEMVWRHIRHGVMRNDGWNALWDVWCGLECVLWDSVMCNLYLNVMCIVWCEVECRRNVEMVCWDVVEWFDVHYGAMWNVVRSVCEIWCNVECCNFRHGVMWNAIEMQTVWCGIWRGVDCGVVVCGMWHNARCGTLRRDVKWGCVELWWWRMWHMQCAVRLLCDDRCGKWCNVLWCQMWWCDVMWNMVWCEMCYDVECGCSVE